MAKVSIFFNGAQQKEVLLDKEQMVIGRDPSCQIHLDNLGISRTHCQVLRKGDTFVVQDLKSSNGTFVNGQKVGEHYLNDKDVISFGKFELRFSKDDAGAISVGGPATAGGGKGDADTLNTFVMDGADIQEKIKKMKEAQQAGGATAASFGGMAGKPKTAKDFGAALGDDDAKSSGGNKGLVIALGGLLVVVVILAVLYFTLWK